MREVLSSLLYFAQLADKSVNISEQKEPLVNERFGKCYFHTYKETLFDCTLIG